MIDTLTTKDIAQDLKKSTRSIQRLLEKREIPYIRVPFKGGFTYRVPVFAYFEWKEKILNSKLQQYEHLSNFDRVYELKREWLTWCRNGLLTGKPFSEVTISSYDYFFDYYIDHLPRRYHRTPLVSLEYARLVLGNLDPKKYSLKGNIYKVLRSFVKFLIAKNHANNELLVDLEKVKPKRAYPPVRLHCTSEDYERLLDEASKRTFGQSEYDAILNKTLIATLGFAGLRSSELCNLRTEDVNLNKRTIFVYLGKGRKNRWLGISSRLLSYLTDYKNARPETKLNNFFITYSKKAKEYVPLNKSTLHQKVERLSKRLGIKINVHGLRRTFASNYANAGKPLNMISLALGHSDLKTTKGYLMTTTNEVIQEMQRW